MKNYPKCTAKVRFTALCRKFSKVKRRFKRIVGRPGSKASLAQIIKSSSSYNKEAIKVKAISVSLSDCEFTVGLAKYGVIIYSQNSDGTQSLEYCGELSDSQDLSLGSFGSFRPSASSSPLRSDFSSLSTSISSYGPGIIIPSPSSSHHDPDTTARSSHDSQTPPRSLTVNIREAHITQSLRSFSSVSSSGIGSPFLSKCIWYEESNAD